MEMLTEIIGKNILKVLSLQWNWKLFNESVSGILKEETLRNANENHIAAKPSSGVDGGQIMDGFPERKLQKWTDEEHFLNENGRSLDGDRRE